MPDNSLKSKTVKGVGWTALETILRYGVNFVVGIILARLLSPEEYGLIGILTIFISVFEIIVDSGLSTALIRKQNAKEVDYCTVFYANFVLSVLLASIFFMCSGIIADFFYRPQLVSLTQVMSIVIVINALAVVQRTRLTKVINFKSQTKISVISSLLSGVIGIILAYAGFGVWALVGLQLSNAGLVTALLWIENKWIPKLQFSSNSFWELWNFGWKLLASGLLTTFSKEINQVVIGKCYSPATLGQYTRAQQFGNLFSHNITTVVRRVTFPVLSEIQDNPMRLKEAYKKVIKLTVFVTFILMLFLAAIAQPLILVLIGKKWLDASYYLQILCFALMMYPLNHLNLNAIQVVGRSDLSLKINVIKNFLTIFPVAIGLLFNIYWMLIAEVVRVYFCYYINAYYSKELLNYPVKEQVKDVMPSLFIALLIATPVFFVGFMPFNKYILLGIQLLVGIIMCSVIMYYICPPEYIELRKILFNLLGKKKYIKG